MAENEELYSDRDIMLLILLVADKLERPVTFDEVWKLIFADDRVSYFEYCTCIDRLVTNGQLTRSADGMYAITDDGRVNYRNLECLIPKSIKTLVETDAESQRTIEKREASIISTAEKRRNGEYSVTLGLDDDIDQIFRLRLVAPNEASAQKIIRNFRKYPEDIFRDILDSIFQHGNEN